MRAMEPLLYQHKAAVVITGHVHGALWRVGVTSWCGGVLRSSWFWKCNPVVARFVRGYSFVLPGYRAEA